MMTSSIKDKTGINIKEIKPIEYIHYIRAPVYMILGSDDELVN